MYDSTPRNKKVVTDSDRSRFMDKLVKQDNGCWTLDATSKKGIAMFSLFGKKTPAHRASWALFRGELLTFKHITHTCKNKSCVNPEHLKEKK